MEVQLVISIIAGILAKLWLPLLVFAAIVAVSVRFRDRLGIFGRLWSHGFGTLGLSIILIWSLIAIFAEQVAPFDPLQQFVLMKNQPPGAVEAQSGEMFLLGADRLARDVFSRIVHGSQFVLSIAPVASALALLTGLLLGLPAGYFGGKVDTVLSFAANLILAFPVILVFYLLVSPGVSSSGLPQMLGALVLICPIAFTLLLIFSRYTHQRLKPILLTAITLAVGGWLFAAVIFDADPLGVLFVPDAVLNILVAVVLIACPGIFRVTRSLTLDVLSRDFIAAAKTRGETSWYIMLFEILPNIRGPLVVDFCLRIGFTTILLGTLGFFGLGLAPDSPDWGTSIKDGSAILRLFAWPALFPALALMSLVLGLNLLADAIRELFHED
ncbi:ABC transporter permease [Shimia sediminis]|uniref:ABC transporter permease n=1 Tax=Shimia sediminis TaxID=2497945 RepID=UPI000F8D8971|nr:ABC transporter permease [Shimia sediminis]